MASYSIEPPFLLLFNVSIPTLCASYLPAPLTEDPEGPGSGHQHMQPDVLQIRAASQLALQVDS